MRYTNGNYEAFVHPRKPENVDQKSAYIIGAGLAGLATAVFLIRDGQMSGDRIHILEELPLSGGSLDGSFLHMMVSLFVVDVKWKTILNVFGTYSEQFRH